MSSNITKELKAAYARYGIETKGNKIVSPIGLISPVLKDGNTKTGKGVKTFSLLAGMREYYSYVYGKVCGTCGVFRHVPRGSSFCGVQFKRNGSR